VPSCLANREEMLRLFRGDFKGSKAFLQHAKAPSIEATHSSVAMTAAIGRSVRRAFTAGGLCTVARLAGRYAEPCDVVHTRAQYDQLHCTTQ
jgi:hypothetical protein